MKVLFICVENTCRSQMAQGFAKALGINCESAGLKAGAGVNPDARVAMDEIGIDISDQYSKTIDSIKNLAEYEVVVSLCHADAGAVCPQVNASTKLNWNIEDPSGASLDEYRRIRNIIALKVEGLKKDLEQ